MKWSRIAAVALCVALAGCEIESNQLGPSGTPGPRFGSISGRVLLPSGSPAANVEVRRYSIDHHCTVPLCGGLATSTLRETVETSEDGSFEFVEVPVGQVEVVVPLTEVLHGASRGPFTLLDGMHKALELRLRPILQSFEVDAEPVTADGRPVLRLSATLTNHATDSIQYARKCYEEWWFEVVDEDGHTSRVGLAAPGGECDGRLVTLAPGESVAVDAEFGWIWSEQSAVEPLPAGLYTIEVYASIFEGSGSLYTLRKKFSVDWQP